jgi:hypothetical protein
MATTAIIAAAPMMLTVAIGLNNASRNRQQRQDKSKNGMNIHDFLRTIAAQTGSD